jgi:hypothetical protein
MKCNPCLHAGPVFAGLLVLAAVWFLTRTSVRSPTTLMDLEDNNPQKFHLWTTGSTFSCAFTCDPHATDIWMFRTAGGTMLVLPPRPDIPPPPTNSWTGG